MKLKIFLLLVFTIMAQSLTYASDLCINLSFPQKGLPGRFSAPKPIEQPFEASGNLLVDITPYPAAIEPDRYEVQYFINDQLVWEGNGFNQAAPDKLDFKFLFDTTRYENGEYKLIVNFWDKKGLSAIGIKKIVIKNE